MGGEVGSVDIGIFRVLGFYIDFCLRGGFILSV